MKKILLNGVDGNFSSRTASILLDRWPHEDLIFTAPTEKGLEKYKGTGVELRVADFNSDNLSEAFKGADTMVLISMPFVGPKRRAAQKTALDAAVKAGVKRLVYTSIVGAGEKDIDTYEVNDHVWFEVLMIGLPSSISQIIMSFSNIMMNNLASGYGDYVISAYGVAGKLTTMVFMITMGYISGYMPFAGYNYGAGQYRRMLSAMKFSLVSGTGVCLVLLIPFLWLAPGFLRLFSSDPEIIGVGVRFLRAYAWVVPFMAIQMTVM